MYVWFCVLSIVLLLHCLHYIVLHFTIYILTNATYMYEQLTSSVAEWLERSLRVWEARVRFPAESSQRFQIVS